LVIVAASLLFLIGMLVLVVDLGHMIAVKREMVRAADAAALAAAQECALGGTTPSADANIAASEIATHNYAGSQLVSLSFYPDVAQCNKPTTTSPKLVTAKLTTSVDMFFAGIFGISSGTVTAQATASWERAGPIPITVNVDSLSGCQWPSGPTPAPFPKECVIEYPKNTLLQPRWGILDLENWDSIQGSCPLSASYVTDIINGGGWTEPLDLNSHWPATSPPTYDCLDNGMQFSSWAALEGRTFLFPVIDVPTSLTDVTDPENPILFEDDPTCDEPSGCNVTNANVIDFVQLQVLAVDKGEHEGDTIVLTVKVVGSNPGSVSGIWIRLVD
jgi:Flp pilus assembly protein TadG